MSAERKVHVVGNWKMNMSAKDIKFFLDELKPAAARETWIAPQAIHIPLLTGKPGLHVGTQDCSEKENGAFTGDLSAASIKDVGAHFTLIGHSERREYHAESDELLNKKTKAALKAGLKVIFCCGETLELREQGSTEATVKHQLEEGLKDLTAQETENIIIAYEPVWAIGTGVTASPEQAQEVHAFIRNTVLPNLNFDQEKTIILYGGSVKPENFSELLNCEDIDGGLVGGASLKASSYNALLG